jgi:hypothetical protein
MLRTLAAQGERFTDVDELAAMLGKKPSGGHWNSGIATLRNNGLIESNGRRYPGCRFVSGIVPRPPGEPGAADTVAPL